MAYFTSVYYLEMETKVSRELITPIIPLEY